MSTAAYPVRPNWPAVVAMSVGVFGIVGSEMLPASMLTAMASDLGVSEGMTGQAVTITAVVALVVSLLAPGMTAKIDRRVMLLSYSLLLAVSNVVVAGTSDYPWMLAGRVALGVAIGGFWTMSAAVTVRLVPERLGPRAMAIVFSGISAATVLAASLGAFLGDRFGWRTVFWLASALSFAGLGFQFFTLPSLPPNTITRLTTIGDVLRRSGIALGIFSATSVYIVHVAFQTYMRPLLEAVPQANSESISFAFLMLGAGGVLGTSCSGFLMERNLRLTLTFMPIVIGVAGIALAFGAGGIFQQVALVFIWGAAYGTIPAAWSMWLTRMVPDQRETASGVFVAAVQISIAIGAGFGGLVFDWLGGPAVYVVGGLLATVSSGVVFRATATANLPASSPPTVP